MKSILIALIIMIGATVNSIAQTIEGKVETLSGSPIADANVSLKKESDSSIVKMAVTNATGKYLFENIASGNYFIEVSNVGFKTSTSKVTVNGKAVVDVETIYLESQATEMNAVVVRAQRRPIEAKADKLIMNVDGTINSVGDDALELLRKAPSVNVDKDDNISISGKSGVQIYIDGKRTPMTAKDLANYLKTIQSSNIDQIEIINNPSAKYDAAGTAGIINIKLKKNSNFGTSGSVNAGWGLGRGQRYTGGGSLNYRNNNWNLFSNLSYYNIKNPQTQDIDRFIGDSSFSQIGRNKWEGAGYTVKLGADYYLSKKSIIGVMVDGTLSNGLWSANSQTLISDYKNGVDRTFLKSTNSNKDTATRMNYNINYRYSDSVGRSITVDLDHLTTDIKDYQLQPNRYFDPHGTNLLYENIYYFQQPSKIDLSSVKVDYEANLWKGKIGVGSKYALVATENTFARYNVVDAKNEYDSSRSNFFKYNEKIAAAYVNYNRSLNPKWSIQAGLRMENTQTEGRSVGFKKVDGVYGNYDSTFKRSYTDLFPSAALTYAMNQKNVFTLDYSRRIQRPVYQDLNPFESFLDEYTYQKGNINLKPQYTNNFGLTHIYKGRLVTKLSYSKVNDVFISLIDTLGSKAFQTRENLASQETWSVNISYNKTWGIYTLISNFNGFNSKFEADYGNGKSVDNSTTSFNIWTQHSFRLPKGFNAELTGFYSSKAIWEGMFTQNPMSQINIGISKNVLKDKGTVKLVMNDIYRGMRFKGQTDFAGQILKINNTWESRQFRVNFNYRFGNTKVKGSNRSTGLEDESSRIKGNN